MSREIKLKAWDGRQMYEWKLHQNPNVENDISFMFVGEDGFCCPWEHPDLTKLQFTGLLDKNGVEIYEGDVIKHPNADHPEDKGWLVEWRANGFELKCMRLVNGEECWIQVRNYLQFEITGNIYES